MPKPQPHYAHSVVTLCIHHPCSSDCNNQVPKKHEYTGSTPVNIKGLWSSSIVSPVEGWGRGAERSGQMGAQPGSAAGFNRSFPFHFHHLRPQHGGLLQSNNWMQLTVHCRRLFSWRGKVSDSMQSSGCLERNLFTNLNYKMNLTALFYGRLELEWI